jgi:ribosome maturation factor RimP
MITETRVSEIVCNCLKETDKFPVTISVKPGNKISVFIDGDTGITIDDCKALSRHIESQFDRDLEDFELSVSSSGLDMPFRLLRQYQKNRGRQIEIVLMDGTKLQGILQKADEHEIEIEQIINKKSKKDDNDKIQRVPLSQIKETRCMISFK